MKPKLRQFKDFEVEDNTTLIIHPVDEEFKGKTEFDILEAIVNYMRSKGWEYV